MLETLFNPIAFGALLLDASSTGPCSCLCTCNAAAGCGSGQGAGQDPIVHGDCNQNY